MEDVPTARPITKRARMRTGKFGVKAASSTPTTKTSAVTASVGRRPTRSATRPPMNAPTMQPTSRRLVTSSCWNEESPPNPFFR